MIVTLTHDAVRALRRYVESADAEFAGMTLNIGDTIVVPQIDGFGPGDAIPVGVDR